MAMTICDECGKAVSEKAPVCLGCGAPVATVVRAKSAKTSVLRTFVFPIIAAFACVFAWISSTSSKPAVVAETPLVKHEVADRKPCGKADLRCFAGRGISWASAQCDDRVEALAKHSVKWTNSFLHPKFTHFRWLDQEAGTITYVGGQIEFQNSFGAFTPMTYECDMSADNEVVLDVRAFEGRLTP